MFCLDDQVSIADHNNSLMTKSVKMRASGRLMKQRVCFLTLIASAVVSRRFNPI